MLSPAPRLLDADCRSPGQTASSTRSADLPSWRRPPQRFRR